MSPQKQDAEALPDAHSVESFAGCVWLEQPRRGPSKLLVKPCQSHIMARKPWCGFGLRGLICLVATGKHGCFHAFTPDWVVGWWWWETQNTQRPQDTSLKMHTKRCVIQHPFNSLYATDSQVSQLSSWRRWGMCRAGLLDPTRWRESGMCVLLLLMCPFGLVLQMFQLFLPYFCVVDGHRKQRLLHSALKRLHAPLILDAVSFLFTGWHLQTTFWSLSSNFYFILSIWSFASSNRHSFIFSWANIFFFRLLKYLPSEIARYFFVPFFHWETAERKSFKPSSFSIFNFYLCFNPFLVWHLVHMKKIYLHRLWFLMPEVLAKAILFI